MPPSPKGPSAARRHSTWLVAAAIVAVVFAAALVVLNRDDSALVEPSATIEPDVTGAPESTPPPTTTQASTTPPVPQSTTATNATTELTDRQRAAASLLTPDEFRDDWEWDTITPRWRMERALAAKVPGCEPFLDTAFESAARPAAVTTAMYTNLSVAAWQYVAVFPDIAGAVAMMDAMRDPTFAQCFIGYYNAFADVIWASQVLESFTLVIAPPDPVNVRADDVITFGATNTDPADGGAGTVGTIPFVRQGRTVIMFDTPPLEYTPAELSASLTIAIARVDAAEGGRPMAPAIKLTDAQIAQATLATASEIGEQWSSVIGIAKWAFDPNLAGTVPACQPFADSVFGSIEGASRSAENFAIDPAEVGLGGGIARLIAIGFPQALDASGVMDGLSDPGFAVCAADYAEATKNSVTTAQTRVAVTGSPPIDLAGYENVVMAFNGTYTWLDGETTPQQRIVTIFVRVDRVVLGVDVSFEFISLDELRAVVDRIVERAGAALAGAPIPR